MSLLTNISKWILSKSESPKNSKQFVSWPQLKSVCIVAFDNQLSGIVDFINLCQKDNIYVHVAVIYNGKPEQAPNPHFAHTLLTKKDFTFFGMPKQNSLTAFTTVCDVLINLGTGTQNQSLALSKLIPAKCRIAGFENSIFDITIQTEKTLNTANYLQQVVVYLNMIKTTK